MAIPMYVEIPYLWDEFGYDYDQVKKTGVDMIFKFKLTLDRCIKKIKDYIVRDMIKLERLYEGYRYNNGNEQDKMFTAFIKRNFYDILEAYYDELEADYKAEANQLMFDSLTRYIPAEQIIRNNISEVR